MRSMTGFGQAAGENERFRMSATLRGVNHRFLDLSMRLRDEVRGAEQALRRLLSSQLWRGRVEVSLNVTAVGSRSVELVVDENAAHALRSLCDDLSSRGLIVGDLELRDLLRLPQVVQLTFRDPDWTAEDQVALLAVVEQALEQMVAARAAEGGELFEALERRLDKLGELTAWLGERWAGLAAELAASLRRRIAGLIDGAGPDEDRLALEVALLVDKSDVSEELDRLESHNVHFRSVMREEGSVGKRLDFLTQEIFRELNTLGAKCRDSEMTRRVLDAKALCEQIREQIQNVE